MQYPFTKEQLALAERTKNFMEQEVVPVAAELDSRPDPKDCYPKDLINKASKIGLRTLALPKEYGGIGADQLPRTIVLWTGAQYEVGTIKCLSQCWKVSGAIAKVGTQKQKDKWLKRFAEDHDAVCSIANSEPDHSTENRLNADDPELGLGSRHQQGVVAHEEQPGSQAQVEPVGDSIVQHDVVKFELPFMQSQGGGRVYEPGLRIFQSLKGIEIRAGRGRQEQQGAKRQRQQGSIRHGCHLRGTLETGDTSRRPWFRTRGFRTRFRCGVFDLCRPGLRFGLPPPPKRLSCLARNARATGLGSRLIEAEGRVDPLTGGVLRLISG